MQRLGDQMPAAQDSQIGGPKSRGAKACVICNKRKIKCTLSYAGGPCENCQAFGYDCVPRERKRKHYCVVTDGPEKDENSCPPRRQALSYSVPSPTLPAGSATRSPETHALPPQNTVQTPTESAEFFQAALNSQFSRPYKVQQVAIPTIESTIVSKSGRPSDAAGAVGFLGRSKYLGNELQDHEDSAVDDATELPHSTLAEDDWKVLNLRRAFDIPPRAVCESLITTFIEKCQPWLPVVDEKTLHKLQNGDMTGTPLLLLQAVFMAGSRMQTTTSVLDQTSVQDYYNRAKVLFFAGYEKDPMTLVTAVTILQYWNPSGPEHVSIHNSSYWMRVGVGLAFQIGLHREPSSKLPDRQIRRRVFWTLFARDSLLSAGQGRPRAIHLEDCNISWPTVEDFSIVDKRAHLFVAYVKISGVLGDLTQWYLRGCQDFESRQLAFESAIQKLIKDLPKELRILDDSGNNRPYDSEVRQLYLPYFTAISILYRPKLRSKSTGCSQATIGSTLASSCVARIFEDELARNEVRNGVAMHAIYLLIAGIGELSNYDYPLLWQSSQHELKVIMLALEELAKTWQTAKGTLRILRRLSETVSSFRPVPNPPPLQPMNLDLSLFKPFGPGFCLKWQTIISEWSTNPTYRDLYGTIAIPPLESTQTHVNDGAMMGSLSSAMTPGMLDSGQMLGREGSLNGNGEGESFELSAPSMMSNILEGLSADSLYSSGNWFLQMNMPAEITGPR